MGPPLTGPYGIDDLLEPMFPSSWRMKVDGKWITYEEYKRRIGYVKPSTQIRLSMIARQTRG